MRRLVALGAALAVMAGLALAIFTSGEAISFSEPNTDSRIGNSVPPNQSQPQDFAGAGSQYYYFGPDFICQIFADSKVECFGSDANGVVSNAPTQTGFTNVDGGETYACAFHQATRFNYCWGGITLRPTTSQPTATPESTSTPEPTATATALPPGATPPAATATSVPTATAIPEPDACEVSFPADSILPVSLTGSWITECVYPINLDNVAAGDRYYRYVRFMPTDVNSAWVANLTSDKDTVMLLWGWDADEDDFVLIDSNDDLAQGNTNSRIEWTPTEGRTYLLDLTTYNANTLGNFTLTIGESSSSAQGSSSGQRMEHSTLPSNTPLERRQ